MSHAQTLYRRRGRFLVIPAQLGFAESLAEIAKKERERRKEHGNENPVRVIEEDDLRDARGPGVIAESTVTTEADGEVDEERLNREGIPYAYTVEAEKE